MFAWTKFQIKLSYDLIHNLPNKRAIAFTLSCSSNLRDWNQALINEALLITLWSTDVLSCKFQNNYKKVLNTNNIKRHCSRLSISFSTAIHRLSKSCSLAFKNITNNLTKTTFIVYVYTPYFNQTQEIKKWKERCVKYYFMFQGCSAFFQGCQKLNMMKSN